MKKAITTIRKTAILLITIFCFGFTQTLQAQDEKGSKAADLKFVGNNEANHPVFQLNLNNTEPDEFLITVKDNDSYILYTGWVKGTNAIQRYQLDVEDEELSNLSFVITGKKTKQNMVYHINKTTKTIQEVLVAKL